ncbi:MAG: aminodeoxychorismate/anthranilate synthase component II [Bacteroidetes bacterium HGW-Bacteroidetes-9]|jgi:anthranilate synthase component 2|nr:MAG: aminodeoxychorismate/anthranilate synthase component II [Bacteroidetes bacterium HGW-Bacteroidetes-9]
MKILLLDNYDSFTFNLVQLLCEAGAVDLTVVKNNQLKLNEAGKYDAFVISPGPGLPSDAGITCDLIREFSGKKRILGVCLGMQAIAEVFGGVLKQPGEIMHGETIHVEPVKPLDSIFYGMDAGFEAGLYHSWAVDEDNLPQCIKVTARDSRGVIMALRHRQFDTFGVQFHPESIMTPHGRDLIANWLKE